MAGRAWSKISHPFLRPAARPGFSVILEDSLWVGQYPTPDDIVWLRDAYGIEAVVSLQEEFDLADKSLEIASLERAYADAGVLFHRFGISDGDDRDLISRLPGVLQELESLLARGQRVYLHCNAGFNRAPSVAIAYLHACRGLSLEQAYAFVKERRPCSPYMKALRAYFGSE